MNLAVIKWGSCWDKDNGPYISEFCLIVSRITSHCISCHSVLAFRRRGGRMSKSSTQAEGGLGCLFPWYGPADQADMESSHQAQSCSPRWCILSMSIPSVPSPLGCILHPHKQTRGHLINTSAVGSKSTGPSPRAGFLLQEDKKKE